MDLSPHRDRLAVLRIADRLEMAAVLVAARDEMEQIIVRQQAQLRQQLGVLRSDAGNGGERLGFR